LELSWIGEVDCGSALPDSILGWKFLYPGSMPPEGQVPSEAEEIARRAAASAAAKLIPSNLTTLSYSNLDWLTDWIPAMHTQFLLLFAVM